MPDEDYDLTEESLEAAETMLLALTPAQEHAVRALVQGGTHGDAAAAADVSRETVSRWATRHPAFRAALTRYRHELAHERADRLRATLGCALSTVHEAVEAGDVTAALGVLRLFPPASLAALLDPPPGSADARAILDSEVQRVDVETRLRKMRTSRTDDTSTEFEARMRRETVARLAALMQGGEVVSSKDAGCAPAGPAALRIVGV